MRPERTKQPESVSETSPNRLITRWQLRVLSPCDVEFRGGAGEQFCSDAAKNGSRIEVALDQGEIRAGRKSLPVGEVELELEKGKPVERSNWPR
jgi:hypothetical protein